jgi:hypothetical protein
MRCVLERHSEAITYSQGFSHIAVAVLQFASDWLAILFLGRLALGALRAFLCEKGAEQAEAMLQFLMPILSLADPALHAALIKKEFQHEWMAAFVMGWGMSIVAPEVRLRYLDFFVASHPLMAVYVVAASFELRAQEISATKEIEDFVLNQLNPVFDEPDPLFSRAVEMFIAWPPSHVLQDAPGIALSRVCDVLVGDGKFAYHFPDFPVADSISRRLYKSRIVRSR